MKSPGKIISRLLALAGLLGVLYLTAHALLQKPVTLPEDVATLLENADEFTLYSVAPYPNYLSELSGHASSTNLFQGHAILGQLEIASPVTRTNLVVALNKGIAAEYWSYLPVSTRAIPNCFNPRHAIRAKKGDEAVELLICFECKQIEITSNKNGKWSYLTTSDPATVFNSILKQANVPLSSN